MFLVKEILLQNPKPQDDGLYCLIGQAQDGAVHFCDVASAPHILVGGYSGSGKSVFLRGVVLSLLMNYTPDEVGLILIDPKQHVEFIVYEEAPHFLGADIQCAERELERRLSSSNPCEKQKKIVVIIDEYAELHQNEADKKIVEKLVQHGHGVGIHVIMATQRVTKSVITPILKENLSTVVACAVAEKRASRFTLGKDGAEKLQGKGDMLYKEKDGTIVRVQAGYVFNEDVQEIVYAVKERYKK